MTNKIKHLMLALIGLLFSSQLVLADIVAGPETYIIGGIGILIVIGIPVGIIALVSYFIIRWIRKKHHPELNKQSQQQNTQNVPK
jgi:membrane protein insertase Oxa1/YidC/SpoIIIJ